MRSLLRNCLIISFLLLLAACGPSSDETAVTLAPDVTPTLPPAGQPGNPVKMFIRPFDIDSAQQQEALLELAILEATNVTVDVVFVERYSEALDALCSSIGEVVSVAWLEGLTYAAASAKNCGTPMVQIVDTVSKRTGEKGVVVLNASLATTELSALDGRRFCRLSIDDFFSWLVPSLALRQAGLTSAIIGEIGEYRSYDALLEAVVTDECNGTAVPLAVYEDFIASHEEESASLTLAYTSVDFPYDVFMVPFEMPLAASRSLLDGLVDLPNMVDSVRLPTPTPRPTLEADATEEATEEPESDVRQATRNLDLKVFFNFEGIQRVPDNPFSEFRTFLAETGLDFSQLGD